MFRLKIINMYKSIIIILITMSSNFCENKDILPGSGIEIEDAVKKSMIVPISDTPELKYKKAVIAKCIAIEEPTEPGQIIIESCNYYQRFKVTEKISGNVNKEFRCDYSIILSLKEKSIRKNDEFILILQDDKAEGCYHLIKALYDTSKNRLEIKSSVEKLSYLINFNTE